MPPFHALSTIAFLALAVLFGAAVTPSHAALVTFSASGDNASDIQTTVDSFRTSLGTLNANVAGSFGAGRREINWDGVPDGSSAPSNVAANFFNVNSPRGVVFSTPGSGFQVSTTAASGTPVEFGNLNATYTDLFATFSPQRLFTALGSTIVDINFFVPGSTTPAFTPGFGAIFSDVDLANTTSIQFFDLANVSLGTIFAPNIAGNETLSFLGGVFNAGEQIGRVALQAGTPRLDRTSRCSPPISWSWTISFTASREPLRPFQSRQPRFHYCSACCSSRASGAVLDGSNRISDSTRWFAR